MSDPEKYPDPDPKSDLAPDPIDHMVDWVARHSRPPERKAEPPAHRMRLHPLEVLRAITMPLFFVIFVPAVADARGTPGPIWFILTALFVFCFPGAWLALLRPALPMSLSARLYRMTLPLSVRSDPMGLGWWVALSGRPARPEELHALEEQLQARAGEPVTGVGIALWGLLQLGRGEVPAGLSVLRFGARICNIPTGAAGRRCCRLLLQCRAASEGRWGEVLDWATAPTAGAGKLHRDHRRLGALAQSELHRAPLGRWDRWQLWWMQVGWRPWRRRDPSPRPPSAGLGGAPLQRAMMMLREAPLRHAGPTSAPELALAWAVALTDPQLQNDLERRAQALGPSASAELALASLEARARRGLRPLLRASATLSAFGLTGKLLEEARREESDALITQLQDHLTELRSLTPRLLPRYTVLGPIARTLEVLSDLRRVASPLELRSAATTTITQLIHLASELHNHREEHLLAHWIMQETLELAKAMGHQNHIELLEGNLKALG